MKTAELQKVSLATPVPHLSMSERLKMIRHLRGLTQQNMADMLAIARPTVAQLEGGRHQPSQEVLETMVAKLEVSRDWLWFGTGPMEETSPVGGNARLLNPLLDVDYIDCPLIPVPARAGFLDLMGSEGDYGQYQTIRIYNPSAEISRGDALAFEIDGDSMEPQLRPHMQVAVVPVALADIKYAVSGVYVVAFATQLTVKRIKDNDLLTKRQLTLHSDNPKAGSLTVAGEDIRGLWKVIDIIRGRVE